jgi:hypothetical protein
MIYQQWQRTRSKWLRRENRVHRLLVQGVTLQVEEEELAPSSSVRRPKWFEKTLQDAQEHVEAPRSTFRESRPPKKFPNFMALRSNVIEDATDHQVYQDAMVQDDVQVIVPGLEGQPVPGGSSRSTFLAKREC